ncbi:MAG: DUF2797 domain-containing protein [Candidatus Bathyarchaeia archaeon]
MGDEYRIAIAYSNIQGRYSVPTTIAGVICHEDDFVELEKRDLPDKDALIRHKDSLASLQTAFDDLAQYLTFHLVIRAEGRPGLREMEDEYRKILNILRSSHLSVITGHIKSITLRAFSSYDKSSRKWHSVEFEGGFLERLSKFSTNYRVLDADYERLLEVAKILASLEYQRLRSFGEPYVTSIIEKNPEEFFQIIRMRWASPPVDEYSGGAVGSPAIVVRDSSTRIRHLYLTLLTKISIMPIAKFCTGSQSGYEVLACKYIKPKNPFGLPLIGSSAEQCHRCRKLFEYSICLYQKPLCNGFQARCGNREFAGNVCCGLFALYVTRFGHDLKVGTAVLSNVIGRVFEQGPGFAYVTYPIEGILTANLLEKTVKDYLAQRIHRYSSFGIANAYRRSPQTIARTRDFLENWYRDDGRLFELVASDLSNLRTSVDGVQIDFAQAEHRICSFLDSYVRPPKELGNQYLSPTHSSRRLEGPVLGYRGSLLFLGSGIVVDIKKLHGFVVRGKYDGAETLPSRGVIQG